MEQNFSERDSIELISGMIKKTRQNLEVGSGNVFLYYGYSSLVIAIATYFTTLLTGSNIWNLLWFLMFVPMAVLMGKAQKEKPDVTTYTDRMLGNTWKIVGLLMILSVIVITVYGFVSGTIYFPVMLPVALLAVSMGSMITGLTVKKNSVTAISIVGFIIPVKVLIDMATGNGYTPAWNLIGGLSFLCTLVISVEEADFVWLKEKTEATAGNLSVQIEKLSEAGYIAVRKEIIGKKPRTTCSITEKGRTALDEYVKVLKEYLHI